MTDLEPTEATVSLDLTEYEASIVIGALDEFRARWIGDEGSDSGESDTAEYLRERVLGQLPTAWTS